MSADSFIVFYGVRHMLTEKELKDCERRQHPLMDLARKARLDHYWGNFSLDGSDRYVLFLGKKIAFLGAEGISELVMTEPELRITATEVDTKLRDGGITGVASFFFQYEPDW